MQTAAISFIKIFLSTFDIGLKKANAVGLPENVILTLLVECIIAILLPVNDIIFDYFLLLSAVQPALRTSK